jgi:hypothetical protein
LRVTKERTKSKTRKSTVCRPGSVLETTDAMLPKGPSQYLSIFLLQSLCNSGINPVAIVEIPLIPLA